jgi:hypothetical protein
MNFDHYKLSTLLEIKNTYKPATVQNADWDYFIVASKLCGPALGYGAVKWESKKEYCMTSDLEEALEFMMEYSFEVLAPGEPSITFEINAVSSCYDKLVKAYKIALEDKLNSLDRAIEAKEVARLNSIAVQKQTVRDIEIAKLKELQAKYPEIK